MLLSYLFFKFLSDNEILDEENSFNKIYKLVLKENETAINYYANIIRKSIKNLFPTRKNDNTTIINRTIFVNEEGELNILNSTLFNTIIKDLYNYEVENGKFKNIDKNFKTKLYESFLKQTAIIKKWGNISLLLKLLKIWLKS